MKTRTGVDLGFIVGGVADPVHFLNFLETPLELKKGGRLCWPLHHLHRRFPTVLTT